MRYLGRLHFRGLLATAGTSLGVRVHRQAITDMFEEHNRLGLTKNTIAWG